LNEPHPKVERWVMNRKSSERNSSRREVIRLEDIPNVGPAIAADLRRLGITSPAELLGRDPYAMYDDLCRSTGQRHDPCLLDTFIAAVRYMAGEPKKPWWKYTAERKRDLAGRNEDGR
jgi:Pathogenicity locus